MESNKQIVKRLIESHVNTGITIGLEAIISPDYTEIHEGIRYPKGIEGAKKHITEVREIYPDLALVISRQIAEGEWVATCYTATGTHSGKWNDIQPTGKKVIYTGVNIDRVVNGKIVEHSGAANMLAQLLKVGAVEVKKKSEKDIHIINL